MPLQACPLQESPARISNTFSHWLQSACSRRVSVMPASPANAP